MTEWRVFNGHMAHAMGRRYPSETLDRPICGANRRWHLGRATNRRSLKCIRCLRILGLKTPKTLRERIANVNAELRTLRMKTRRV